MFGDHKRILELADQVAKLKRMVEDRDLDWVDMRQRCKRLLDRTEKAAARVEAGEIVVASEPQTTQGNGEGTLEANRGRLLSAHQLEVQQQILRRRASL